MYPFSHLVKSKDALLKIMFLNEENKMLGLKGNQLY